LFVILSPLSDLDTYFGVFGAIKSIDFKGRFSFVHFLRTDDATAAAEKVNRSKDLGALGPQGLVAEFKDAIRRARYSSARAVGYEASRSSKDREASREYSASSNIGG
jgi:hypothetical protein